jgi:DNA-directed RNA polymerase specialized sigma24 family protein
MTSVSTLSRGRAALEDYVAAPSTLSRLRAFVRRRGLSGDVDDVVQTVLCDALAAPAPPVDPGDVARWVTGIAKRKVVDEHRRRARWVTGDVREPAISAEPDAAELLRRIDAELTAPAERHALSCVLREHAGESLLEIARAESLAPEALRQRICRLRRHLKARYAAALVLFLAVGAGTAAGVLSRGTGLPAATTHARSLAGFAGTWRVVAASPEKYGRLGLVVVIAPDGIRVRGPAGFVEREVSVEPAAGDALILRSGGSTWHATLDAASGDRLTLTTDRGFVTLERTW